MTQAAQDADLAALETPAILAWRPYPPRNLPDTRSQLGGLPLLSSPADWPRTQDGAPLHFLARIDCKDLPGARGGLPSEGLLQFFARIDEDMGWADDERQSDHCRVLHSLEAGQLTPPPAELPIIQGGYNDWDRTLRLPEEPPRTAYPRWPLVFAAIKSWPDTSHWGPNQDEEGTNRARAAEIARATGEAPFEEATPTWLNNPARGGKALALPPSAPGERAFPQAWILCDRVARCFARAAIDSQQQPARAKPAASPEEADARNALLAEWAQLEQSARAWIRRAEAAGLDAPVDPAEASEFAEWLTALANHSSQPVRSRVCAHWNGSMRRGLEAAIVYCGGHPAAAALVPLDIFNQLRDQHALVRTGERDGQPWLKPSDHHQLLGNHQSTQDFRPNDNEVLLLQLVSDYGVDFMFCDVGEIHFWIDGDDLAARRFDRVRANTQGG
jgi:hypothetical protein